jgi:hypothetical protein
VEINDVHFFILKGTFDLDFETFKVFMKSQVQFEVGFLDL